MDWCHNHLCLQIESRRHVALNTKERFACYSFSYFTCFATCLLNIFQCFAFLEMIFSHLIINSQLDTYKTGFLENIAQLHKIKFLFLSFLYSISVCLGQISSKYDRCSCNTYVHYTLSLFNSRCQYSYQ